MAQKNIQDAVDRPTPFARIANVFSEPMIVTPWRRDNSLVGHRMAAIISFGLLTSYGFLPAHLTHGVRARWRWD